MEPPTATMPNKKKESENQKKKRNKEEIDKQTEESGSEGTEESGSKGTEENGSEATEGGSNGIEENMNGDEREEKQDSNKVENAKVDNVEEKQGDHKDKTGEDEYWNTQFTDSQCEELKNQVKEEIKKKKTAKRKSTKEMTPPSFSLGISSDTNKGTTVIIDKSKTPMSYEAKYKKVCDVLKNMFSMHLKEVQHPRAKDVLNKKPTILRPKWGTEENNTDCGVFLMMHMENYNGENARNWNLEFPTEEEGNRYDIIKMRMRFAAKMLSHEINIHREEMSKQALEFADRNKEKKAREALIRGAIRVKKEKQESERVQSAI
ncbi:ulp1 protease family, C-terminal catalytic domain-containing protein [Tanacetum coccineum]